MAFPHFYFFTAEMIFFILLSVERTESKKQSASGKNHKNKAHFYPFFATLVAELIILRINIL
jgi:hypothetical protein